jgi:hypothetical protein
MANAPTQASGGQAVKRSIPRVIIFYLLSPLYAFYWFYQTRNVVTQAVGGKDQVGLQTLGLIVPILNIFIMYWLFRDVDKFNRANGGQGFPALWFILGPIILAIIPLIGMIAPLVGLVLFIIVLSRLNEALDKQGATEAPYTTGEIATVAAGVILWILYFVVFASLLAAGTATNSIDVNSTYSY